MPSAAILAGGAARRFGGRDKGELLVDGRSIRERQLEELATIADDIMIVGTDPGSVPQVPGIRHVHDRVPGCGPLGGLDAALAAARDDLLVLVACDMPFITGAFLEYLVSHATGRDAVVPQTKRGYHPVCAVYRQTCRNAVERAIAERRLSMMDLLKTIGVRTVEEDEIEAFGPAARLLANVNTPAEFVELGAFSSHKL